MAAQGGGQICRPFVLCHATLLNIVPQIYGKSSGSRLAGTIVFATVSLTRGVLDLIVYCFEVKSTILVLFARWSRFFLPCHVGKRNYNRSLHALIHLLLSFEQLPKILLMNCGNNIVVMVGLY